MTALQEKLRKEATGKMLIVSNTFALPDLSPSKVIHLDDLFKTKIYIYRQ